MSAAAAAEMVRRVMALPYRWPAPPSAAAARAAGWGSCASKHALLAEELASIGISSRPLFAVGPLVPDVLADVPEIAPGVGLLEVHELLTVSVPDVGPCRVDVTWDPALIVAGMPGTLDWDAASDMQLAIDPVVGFYAPDPSRLREEKEALRRRLYGDGERDVRDRVLAAMSERFAMLRSDA